jgi:hypothetical protein
MILLRKKFVCDRKRERKKSNIYTMREKNCKKNLQININYALNE